jgi:hypothetical protein
MEISKTYNSFSGIEMKILPTGLVIHALSYTITEKAIAGTLILKNSNDLEKIESSSFDIQLRGTDMQGQTLECRLEGVELLPIPHVKDEQYTYIAKRFVPWSLR